MNQIGYWSNSRRWRVIVAVLASGMGACAGSFLFCRWNDTDFAEKFADMPLALPIMMPLWSALGALMGCTMLLKFGAVSGSRRSLDYASPASPLYYGCLGGSSLVSAAVASRHPDNHGSLVEYCLCVAGALASVLLVQVGFWLVGGRDRV